MALSQTSSTPLYLTCKNIITVFSVHHSRDYHWEAGMNCWQNVFWLCVTVQPGLILSSSDTDILSPPLRDSYRCTRFLLAAERNTLMSSMYTHPQLYELRWAFEEEFCTQRRWGGSNKHRTLTQETGVDVPWEIKMLLTVGRYITFCASPKLLLHYCNPKHGLILNLPT